MTVYHKVYQNDEGMWCVSYTKDGEFKVNCFNTRDEAMKFYMKD